MKYSVDSVKITLAEDETLVAGSVGVHYAEFAFDESWGEYAKTAVFRNGNVTVEAIVVDGRCEIPWEVLADAGLLHVGIRGESGGRQRPTLWAPRKTVHEGAQRGDEPREPAPDIYQQLLAAIADIKDGKTPERGVDYYTEADKAEMVTAVLAALPEADNTIVFEDDGEGNVTIRTENEKTEVVLTDDGDGNVRLEII